MPYPVAAARGHWSTGAAWVPSDYTGLQVWLDGSDETTLYTDAGSTLVTGDGDLIYQINDKSENGRHAAQSTAGNRPTYKVNIQNSLSVARFNGSSSYWSMSKMTCFVTAISVFVVVNTTDDETEHRIFDWENDGSNPHYNRIQLDTDADNIARAIGYDTTDRASTIAGDPSGLALWGLTAVEGGQVIAYKNDTTGAGVNISTFGNSGADSPTIGVHRGIVGGDWFSGDFMELIAYDSVISGNDLTSLKNYLNAKWSIY